MMQRHINAPGVTVAAATAALLTAACSGPSGGSDTESEAGSRTIQLLTFASPEQVQPVLDAFAVDHPDVTVEVQSVPFGDLNSVVQSRVGGGDEDVDVYLVDQPRLAGLAADGMLMDLTDSVDVPDGAILPEAMEASTYDGGLYALPVQTSTQLLFYNADLLQESGIEVPTVDPEDRLTWEEVVDQAAAVQADGASWGLLFEQGATPYQLLPLPESLGGGPGLTGDQMLVPDLTGPQWQEAMTWWHDVHEDGVAPRGMGFGVTTETFASGDAAFLLAGPWNLGILGGQDLDFEWGVTAHPYFAEGQPVTPTGSFAWGVNPATDAPDAAADLVEFVATTAEGSLAVAEGDPNLPTQTEALETFLSGDVYADGVGDLILHELGETAVVRPVSTGYVEFETVLGATLEDIRNGLPVTEQLQAAQTELESVLQP